MDRFVPTNSITIHCLEFEGDGPTIVLLPGLTANANSFGGLVDAGLSPALHVLALDLRGRGLSDHPESGYTIADHAADVVGLIDTLGLDTAIPVGHSFGGMLTYYLAANFPERFPRIVSIDAPAEIDPMIMSQIKPSLERLGTPVASWEAYLSAVKAQPYFGDWWDPLIEAYYRADVKTLDDGRVQARSHPETIQAVVEGTLEVDWTDVVSRVTQPTLTIRATGPYGPPGSPPILPKEKADRVISLLADPHPLALDGNHMSILFGQRAPALVSAILEFVGAG
jgi:pimeloyl-ACP methyl ester carboxylesterase